MIRYIFAGIFFSLFSGCTLSVPAEEQRDTPVAIEKKEVFTGYGLILSKDLDYREDGTHYLVTEDKKSILLKSHIVDLSQYEGKQVFITGESASSETQSDVSLVIVYAVDVRGNAEELRTSVFSEIDLGITLSLPGSWQRKEATDGGVQYFPEGGGSEITIAVIDENTEKEGDSVMVGGRKGVRTVTKKEIQVFVPLPEKDTSIDTGEENHQKALLFLLKYREDHAKNTLVFYEMLTTLTWEASLSPEAPEKEQASETIFCGGIAKKPCPSGYRCEIQGQEENASGVCADVTLAPREISQKIFEPEKKKLEEVLAQEYIQDWTRYTRDRHGFSFSLPKSWWWNETVSSLSGVRIQIDTASEELTETNTMVMILLASPETIYDDVLGTVVRRIPKDDTTVILVIGEEEQKNIVDGIAASLVFL